MATCDLLRNVSFYSFDITLSGAKAIPPLLMSRSGKVFDREEIYGWVYDTVVGDRTIDMHITQTA